MDRILNWTITILIPFFSASATYPPVEEGNLVLEVDNINSAVGYIWIGIYDSEQNYLIKEKGIIEGYQVSRTGKMTLDIHSLPFGSYAIALFHDENGNGKMDRNFIGIPSEPYAFSKKEKSKWRIPRFKEIQFDFSQSGQKLSTKLKKWGKD